MRSFPAPIRAALLLLTLCIACETKRQHIVMVDGGASAPPIGSEHACVRAPIDLSHATSLYEAMRCLFEGADAPQRVVQPGTITPERIAVVRGRVLDFGGQPLAGARVSVFAHPEYGRVTTGSDGTYDLAFNGGGTVISRFERLD